MLSAWRPRDWRSTSNRIITFTLSSKIVSPKAYKYVCGTCINFSTKSALWLGLARLLEEPNLYKKEDNHCNFCPNTFIGELHLYLREKKLFSLKTSNLEAIIKVCFSFIWISISYSIFLNKGGERTHNISGSIYCDIGVYPERLSLRICYSAEHSYEKEE